MSRRQRDIFGIRSTSKTYKTVENARKALRALAKKNALALDFDGAGNGHLWRAKAPCDGGWSVRWLIAVADDGRFALVLFWSDRDWNEHFPLGWFIDQGIAVFRG